MAKSKSKNKAKQAAPLTTQMKPYRTLSDLKDHPDLWYKIRVLIYDLHNIKTSPQSLNRTLQTTDPLYISAPYFTPEQATLVKAVLVDEETTLEQTLSTRLENFFEKRKASGDFRPCGPHDLVPIYLECLRIGKEEIEEEKFVSRVKRSGV